MNEIKINMNDVGQELLEMATKGNATEKKLLQTFYLLLPLAGENEVRQRELLAKMTSLLEESILAANAEKNKGGIATHEK